MVDGYGLYPCDGGEDRAFREIGDKMVIILRPYRVDGYRLLRKER